MYFTVLCTGVFLISQYVAVGAIYFSMIDIQMNLSGNKTKYLPENHALVTLNALQTDKRKNTFLPRYSLEAEGPKYLAVYPSTGDIMFTETFLETKERITDVSVRTAVEDSLGRKNYSTFQVNIFPSNMLDCDLITQDLCYWQSVTYRIFENREATTLGSLTSPYLVEMCKGFRFNYTVVKDGYMALTLENDFGHMATDIIVPTDVLEKSRNIDFQLFGDDNFNPENGALFWYTGQSHFTVMPPTNESLSWSLRTIKPLERDVIRTGVSVDKSTDVGHTINITVICSIVDSSETRRELSRNLTVNVLDEDDNVPEAQVKLPININFSSAIVHENSMVFLEDLLLIDKDSVAVNHYDVRILNDTLNLLKPNWTVYDHDPWTVIHCKLIFTKSMQMSSGPYKVILQINDTSLLPEFGSGVVNIPIHLNFNATDESTREKPSPLLLYPSHEVKIFRDAMKYARVTQPDKTKNLGSIKNFDIHPDSNANGAFGVTSDGIVYVQDISLVKEERARIKVHWSKKKKEEFDIIEVLLTNEPTATHLEQEFMMETCSEVGNKHDCENTKSVSTGGAPSVQESKLNNKGRCVWHGHPQGSKNVTAIYSTCTPDRHTCPDGICDSLENLDYLICPQDCSERDRVQFPLRVNNKTGRGVMEASGIVLCDDTGMCHNIDKPTRKKKKPPTSVITTSTTTSTEGSTLLNESLSQSMWPTINRRTDGVDVASCGTKCMLGIAAGALFLIGAVAVVVACWKFDRVHKATRDKFSSDNQDLNVPLSDYVDRGVVPDTIHLNFDMSGQIGHTVNFINKLAPDPKWEFPRSQLIIEQTLGEGEFGRVLRARAKDIGGHPGYTTVAVKTLKDDAREPELADLLSEYQLLKEVNHPNIIKLLGASTLPGGPVYLIIEFAQFGSLRSYLRRSRHLKSESHLPSSIMRFEGSHQRDELYDEPVVNQVTAKDILSFGWQICNGMSYLSEIKLVHRDLAARNVLLAAGKICKISDFGLTRDIYEDDAYYKRSKGRVPVKWMAPESLSDHIYTNKSDVWSFGILVWELVTLGATPYPGIQVQNLFHLLKSGYRMERPENCSPALYKIMKSCWHIDSEQRPTFAELAVKWEKMLTDIVEYLDLTPNVIHNRSYFCTADTEGNMEFPKEIHQDDGEEDNVEKSPDQSETSNLLENSSQYVKCGESNKLLGEETEKVLSTPIIGKNDTQGYETPIKTKRVDVATPTNECPQYYTNMCTNNNRKSIPEAI